MIGDGALSAGMAYEAMNNAAAAGNRLIVILNDNDMSIAPPVGIAAQQPRAAGQLGQISDAAQARAEARAGDARRRCTARCRRMEEYARGWLTGGTLFEELGFYYVGPVDGHDVRALVEVLENVRDAEIGPMLVHVVTKKGKGYAPAENAADKYHGVVKFDVVSGVQAKPAPGAPSYTSVYRQGADRRDGARREGRRDHRGDAVGHRPRQGRRAISRPRCSTSASPSSMR